MEALPGWQISDKTNSNSIFYNTMGYIILRSNLNMNRNNLNDYEFVRQSC